MRAEELKTAKTESRFRDVNERIAVSAEQFGTEELALVCECADPNCGQQIDTPLDEYEETRSDGAHFLVAPGHEVPDHERVVKTGPGYRIVEKLRAVGAVARRLNPRPAR